MAFHRCAICLEDGSVVAERVNITLEETEERGGPTWYGTISVTHVTNLPAGQRFRIRLDDGRTGEFVVRRNTYAGGADRAVAIRGTGPLACEE